MNNESTKPFFDERQKFDQWWLYLLLSSGFLVPLIITIISSKSIFTESMLVCLLVSMLLSGILWMTTLKTKIDNKSIQVHYAPFLKKQFDWEEIESYEVLNWGFIGGWGIRMTFKYGTVYNVKGNEGLFIKLKNGKKIGIGTQKPEQLEEFLKQLRRS